MLIVSVSIGAFNYHTHHRPIKPKWLDFYDIQVRVVVQFMCPMYVYVRMYACVLCVPMCVCLLMSIPYGPISGSTVVAFCGDYCSIGYPMASKSEPNI